MIGMIGVRIVPCAYWVWDKRWLLQVFLLYLHVLFFMNAGSNPHSGPDKTARHESISRLRFSAFVHGEFLPKSSFSNKAKERRRDMDSCFAVLSGPE